MQQNPLQHTDVTLRLLTISDDHCHLLWADDIPTFKFRQQHALVTLNGLLEPKHCSPDTQNLAIHMVSNATPCRRMSSSRRFEWSCCLYPRRQAIQEPEDTASPPTRPNPHHSVRMSSTRWNKLQAFISHRGLECADFDLHAPTNYGLTRRQIYRVHP